MRINEPIAYILLYAALYAAFGVASPFWPKFFETRGLISQQIGFILAAAMLLRNPIVTPDDQPPETGRGCTCGKEEQPQTEDQYRRKKHRGRMSSHVLQSSRNLLPVEFQLRSSAVMS